MLLAHALSPEPFPFQRCWWLRSVWACKPQFSCVSAEMLICVHLLARCICSTLRVCWSLGKGCVWKQKYSGHHCRHVLILCGICSQSQLLSCFSQPLSFSLGLCLLLSALNWSSAGRGDQQSREIACYLGGRFFMGSRKLLCIDTLSDSGSSR